MRLNINSQHFVTASQLSFFLPPVYFLGWFAEPGLSCGTNREEENCQSGGGVVKKEKKKKKKSNVCLLLGADRTVAGFGASKRISRNATEMFVLTGTKRRDWRCRQECSGFLLPRRCAVSVWKLRAETDYGDKPGGWGLASLLLYGLCVTLRANGHKDTVLKSVDE